MTNNNGALANGVEYNSIINNIVKNDDHKTSFYKIFIDMIWSQEPEKIDLLTLAKLAMKDHAAVQNKHALADQIQNNLNNVKTDFIAEIWSVEGKSPAKLDFDVVQAANANDAAAGEGNPTVDAVEAPPSSPATTDQISHSSHAQGAVLPPQSIEPSELLEDIVYGPSFAQPDEESQDDAQNDAGEVAPAPVYNVQDIMMMIFNDKNQREQAEINSGYDDYGYMDQAA